MVRQFFSRTETKTKLCERKPLNLKRMYLSFFFVFFGGVSLVGSKLKSLNDKKLLRMYMCTHIYICKLQVRPLAFPKELGTSGLVPTIDIYH